MRPRRHPGVQLKGGRDAAALIAAAGRRAEEREAIEMRRPAGHLERRITDADAAADHQLAGRIPGEAKARAESFVPAGRAGAVQVSVRDCRFRRTAMRPNARSRRDWGGGAEVGALIAGNRGGRIEFVAQADIERQLGSDSPIVLDEISVVVVAQQEEAGSGDGARTGIA